MDRKPAALPSVWWLAIGEQPARQSGDDQDRGRSHEEQEDGHDQDTHR
jgi:hypothetical protein